VFGLWRRLLIRAANSGNPDMSIFRSWMGRGRVAGFLLANGESFGILAVFLDLGLQHLSLSSDPLSNCSSIPPRVQANGRSNLTYVFDVERVQRTITCTVL